MGLYVNIAIMTISLYHGASTIVRTIDAVAVILFIFYLLYQAGVHYFDDNLDFQRNFLGNKLSVRNIIISSAIDLTVWLSYNAYIIIKYPNTIFLTSKMQINWIRE